MNIHMNTYEITYEMIPLRYVSESMLDFFQNIPNKITVQQIWPRIRESHTVHLEIRNMKHVYSRRS